MSESGVISDFLRDLKLNIDDLSDAHMQALWSECAKVEERLDGKLDEMTLSVINRVAQAAYVKALDTMVEGLRLTLLGDGDVPQ
ncbi:hypothetical protein SDC9_120425 [bioreactor metagenome]|uniref:Uncharacterized protein n=1 Tax=bioreactor metagenome TaxID=1076179 RepID=A0A645C782_9ZZZZ